MPTGSKHKAKMLQLRIFYHKAGMNKSLAIQRMLKANESRTQLQKILRSPVSVECGTKKMMTNVYWNVELDARYARDHTGQKLDLSQTVFDSRVEIRLSRYFDHTFPDGSRKIWAKGTTGQFSIRFMLN
jgi:hypothetical protein